MDIRIQKTEAAIKSAFMELRSQKPIEKITVKELCQRAQINKSTFYTHYSDIYALSEAMQAEAIAFVLGTIAQREDRPEQEDLGTLARAVFHAALTHRSLINDMFSPRERARLAGALEAGIKEIIYRQCPRLRDDVEKNILLSYCIQGAYHAYLSNQDVDEDTLAAVIERIAKTLQPLY